MYRKDLIMLCRLCVEMLRGTEYNASLKKSSCAHSTIIAAQSENTA